MPKLRIEQTRQFARTVKKLPKKQKAELDGAVQAVAVNPAIGEQKKGDLAGVRVHKFRMNRQAVLLAYSADETQILLLALGSHENFYRDLKAGH